MNPQETAPHTRRRISFEYRSHSQDVGQAEPSQVCMKRLPDRRLGRVAVRRNDSSIFVGINVGLVLNLIERRLELSGAVIDDVFVHDAVVHHNRQTVDGLGFGDVLGLSDAGIDLRHRLGLAIAAPAVIAAAERSESRIVNI